MKLIALTKSVLNVTLILLLYTLTGYGQGAVSLEVDVVSDYEVYYIADLDPRAIGSGVRVFSLDMTNTGSDFQCQMRITFYHGADVIAEGLSDLFFFAAGDRLYMDNRIIQENHASTEAGITVDMNSYEFHNEFLDNISGNILPTGIYRVYVEVMNDQMHLLATDEASFAVTNPDAVWLLSPMNHVGVVTATPVFAWSSNARQFRIRVCKAESGQTSGEDIMTNVPVWETETEESTIQYPAAGARILEPGGDYYWQVSALVSTSLGEREFPSDIRHFVYDIEGDEQMNQELYEVIHQFLPDDADAIMAQLVGYYISGPVMLDGVPVDQRVFQDFLQRVIDGEYDLSEIQLQ